MPIPRVKRGLQAKPTPAPAGSGPEATDFSLFSLQNGEHVQSPLASAAVNPEPKGRKTSILIVDDDPVLCALGREVLEHLGYRVAVAQAGPEAVRLYCQDGRMDLVILDYYLPGQSGVEVLQELKGLDPQARVLLASGFVAPQEQANLREKGALGVIQKPFRMGELEGRIREALAAPVL